MDENGGYPCLGDGLRFCFLARVFSLAAFSLVGICACAGFALRAGFLNVNGRQWPLMVVNVFWVGYGANAR